MTQGSSSTDPQGLRSSDGVSPLQAVRVDPAHLPGHLDPAAAADSLANLRDLPSVSVGAPLAANPLGEQMQLQAQQLAEHLQRNQQTLDRRESQLHAQLAAMETEMRGARLWLSERQDALEQLNEQLSEREKQLDARAANLDEQRAQSLQRASELDSKEQFLAERFSHLAIAESTSQARMLAEQEAIAERGRQFEQREAKLQQRELTLDQRQSELEEQFGPARIDARLQAERQRLAERESQLRQRQSQLESGEKLLVEQQAALEAEHKNLKLAAQAQAEDLRAARQQVTKQQRRMEAELAQREKGLKERSLELEHRREATAEMHAQVLRIHRETLEIRLATQEVWGRLSGRVGSPETTAAISQTRVKLAQQFRLEQEELAQRKEELRHLAAGLQQQQAHLISERTRLQESHAARETEIGAQAAQLARRQDELDELGLQLRRQETAWLAERYQMQAEIRNLLRELRRAPMAA